MIPCADPCVPGADLITILVMFVHKLDWSLRLCLPDVRGVASRDEDISLVKTDFFTAFSRRNLNSPVADLSNPNFGRITGAGAARTIQLGWRMDSW